ncbi:MAG: hypothetical protein QXG86_01285 [Candidatus Woesearchaeota archaeon]
MPKNKEKKQKKDLGVCADCWRYAQFKEDCYFFWESKSECSKFMKHQLDEERYVRKNVQNFKINY